jgi:DNA topoisomerase III
MKTVIIAEKGSQARDIRAAIGDRHGQVLPAEGHLLRLAEPEEVDPAWQRWSFALLKPEGLYPTRLDRNGNKAAKLKAIRQALKGASRVIIATDCDREASSSARRSSSTSGSRARCCGRCSPPRTRRRYGRPSRT